MGTAVALFNQIEKKAKIHSGRFGEKTATLSGFMSA
jgi:hypothetical protein